MNRTLLKSAKVLSATIVVMQKLARTLNAAEKPMKSIHTIASLPHSALVWTSYGGSEAIEGLAVPRADEGARSIDDHGKSTKQPDYRAKENKKSEPLLRSQTNPIPNARDFHLEPSVGGWFWVGRVMRLAPRPLPSRPSHAPSPRA
jgi:hypothetical protein